MVTINTAIMGELSINEEQILTFPEGIPGFADYRRFVILSIEPELPFAYLQSMDEGLIHFVIANPFQIVPTYDIQIDEETQRTLDIQSVEEVEVWNILTMRDSFENVTVNLLAPVILNSRNGIGKQVVLHQSGYTTRHLLSDLMSSMDDHTETKG
ncbi:flagellar assembly protein FliW [Paenibacillus filicis]|uniref:Flagellar assembly factor FliW n=1 Tax=Paenibacillus filicis TaxID=669464 RepID=A0ABU9DS70_9BACL